MGTSTVPACHFSEVLSSPNYNDENNTFESYPGKANVQPTDMLRFGYCVTIYDIGDYEKSYSDLDLYHIWSGGVNKTTTLGECPGKNDTGYNATGTKITLQFTLARTTVQEHLASRTV